MTCKSTVKKRHNVDFTWCDGSEVFAYEIHMGCNRWQAFSLYYTHWNQELQYMLFTGALRKAKKLPKDHWHSMHPDTYPPTQHHC